MKRKAIKRLLKKPQTSKEALRQTISERDIRLAYTYGEGIGRKNLILLAGHENAPEELIQKLKLYMMRGSLIKSPPQWKSDLFANLNDNEGVYLVDEYTMNDFSSNWVDSLIEEKNLQKLKILFGEEFQKFPLYLEWLNGSAKAERNIIHISCGGAVLSTRAAREFYQENKKVIRRWVANAHAFAKENGLKFTIKEKCTYCEFFKNTTSMEDGADCDVNPHACDWKGECKEFAPVQKV